MFNLILDQQPHNQDPSNLRALCTVCHLQFDSRFRAKQRRLKAEFLGQLCIDDAWPAGVQLSLLPQAVVPFSVPRQGEASGRRTRAARTALIWASLEQPRSRPYPVTCGR